MGRRLFTSGRWNWSQKAETLTIKMKELNEKLLKTTNPEENSKIFSELMKVS